MFWKLLDKFLIECHRMLNIIFRLQPDIVKSKRMTELHVSEEKIRIKSYTELVDELQFYWTRNYS